MALDPREIEREILQALKNSLSQAWPAVSSYAVIETKKIAKRLIEIERLYRNGSISENEAQLLLDEELHHTRLVLLTFQGLSQISVERAISSAVSAISASVNSSIGFNLCSTGGGSRDH